MKPFLSTIKNQINSSWDYQLIASIRSTPLERKAVQTSVHTTLQKTKAYSLIYT